MKKKNSTDGNYTSPCIFNFSNFLKVIKLNVIYNEHNTVDLPDIKYSFYKKLVLPNLFLLLDTSLLPI